MVEWWSNIKKLDIIWVCGVHHRSTIAPPFWADGGVYVITTICQALITSSNSSGSVGGDNAIFMYMAFAPAIIRW